jgi:hypothetical protein
LDGVPVVFLSSPDEGVYDAMNIALGHATGEWVIFANGGDFVHIDKCIEAIELYSASSSRPMPATIIAGSTTLVYPGGVRRISSGCRLQRPYGLSSSRMSSFHQSQLISRSIYKSQRFRADLPVSADHAFFWEAVSNGARVEVSSEVLSAFYLGGLSTFAVIRSSIDVWYSMLNIQNVPLFVAYISICRRVVGHFFLLLLYLVYAFRSRPARIRSGVGRLVSRLLAHP